ncbi:MAG: protein arginine kinase [Firmicutes bacterium]|nr:protein arginine kinase [Bacillota bacterium]
MIWYKDNDNDIVISTRVRLARNLDGVPFPNALENKAEVTARIKTALAGSNSTLSKELEFTDLDTAAVCAKRALEEEHLISPQMLDGKGHSVFVSRDKTMSIMLMEEDHIRLQVIKAGNALDEAYDTATKIDDVIEENLTYAFDEEFGYLTACPTNAGTGMRASVMMHLPALTMTRNINNVISSAGSLGIAVRGLYGEGSTADGNFFQISNQITMGISEEEILKKLKSIVEQIEDAEKKARDYLKSKSLDALSDKVYRSYGTLKYARRLTSAEVKSLISDVMLGRGMGIITEKGKKAPVECMILSEPSILSGGKNLTPDQRDTKRAELIRENI